MTYRPISASDCDIGACYSRPGKQAWGTDEVSRLRLTPTRSAIFILHPGRQCLFNLQVMIRDVLSTGSILHPNP